MLAARGESDNIAPVEVGQLPLRQRFPQTQRGFLRDRNGHEELHSLPLRDDMVATRFILGGFVDKNRPVVSTHTCPPFHTDSASNSGADTAVNCKQLITKGNFGFRLTNTSLPLGGVGLSEGPPTGSPVLSLAES